MTIGKTDEAFSSEIAQLREELALAQSERNCMEERLKRYNELAHLAAEVSSYFASRAGSGVDAPGHCHTVKGVWDASNKPELAGKSCEWCATWAKFHEALDASGVMTDGDRAWGGFMESVRQRQWTASNLESTADMTAGTEATPAHAPQSQIRPMNLDAGCIFELARGFSLATDGHYSMTPDQVVAFANAIKARVSMSFQPGYIELRRIITHSNAISKKAMQGAAALEEGVDYKQRASRIFDEIDDFSTSILAMATCLQPRGIVLA